MVTRLNFSTIIILLQNFRSKDYARERSGPSNPTTLIKTIPPSTNRGDGDAQDTGGAYS